MDNVFRILNLSLPSSTSFFTSSCFLSSQYSVPSLSLSLILWREVTNRIAGHSIPYPTNSRNPFLEDMMPTILNSSIFYLTSTRIKLSKGHTFIWILCIRCNSRPFITYMVWLWFEFACVHYSNTMFCLFLLLEGDLICGEKTTSPAVPDAELQNQLSLTASHHMSSAGLFRNIWQSCVMLFQPMSGSVPKRAVTSHAHLPRLIYGFFLLSEWSTEPNHGFEAALHSLLRWHARKWAGVVKELWETQKLPAGEILAPEGEYNLPLKPITPGCQSS